MALGAASTVRPSAAAPRSDCATVVAFWADVTVPHKLPTTFVNESHFHPTQLTSEQRPFVPHFPAQVVQQRVLVLGLSSHRAGRSGHSQLTSPYSPMSSRPCPPTSSIHVFPSFLSSARVLHAATAIHAPCVGICDALLITRNTSNAHPTSCSARVDVVREHITGWHRENHACVRNAVLCTTVVAVTLRRHDSADATETEFCLWQLGASYS